MQLVTNYYCDHIIYRFILLILYIKSTVLNPLTRKNINKDKLVKGSNVELRNIALQNFMITRTD